jgi:NADPH-dependent 2,4-dienoyl-CoA reductase/sulfur reductase-like enzyme
LKKEEEVKYFLYIPDDLPISVLPKPFPQIPGDPRKVAIVGGGNAGLGCALALRRMEFGGQITIVNDANTLPFDKKKVQNDFDIEESLPLDQITQGYPFILLFFQ